MKKKLIPFVLIMAVIVLVFSGCDSLSNNVGSVKYKVVDDHAEVVALPNGSSDTEIFIDDEYEGVPVTKINDFAGNNLESAQIIHIGKNVADISEWAFSNNQKLETYDVAPENQSYTVVDGALLTADMKTVLSYPCGGNASFVMPNTVTEVAPRAFYKCEKLESLTLSSSLEIINEMSFFQCSAIKELAFPNTIKFIGKDAFSKCTSLTEITIPASIEEIREYAFYNCTELKQVKVNKAKEDIKLGDKWYPTNNGIKIDDLNLEYK